MDENNRNFILAIVLSIGILLVWQVLYNGPKLEKERARQQQEIARQKAEAAKQIGKPEKKTIGAPNEISAPTAVKSRANALGDTQRIKVETPNLSGSISLKGARLDDLTLLKYRETVKKDAKNVVLFSPSGTKKAYYAEHGWSSTGEKVPTQDTIWTVEGGSRLTPETPVKLKYDNGEGLIFHRTVSVDKNFLFTIKQEVENKTAKAVTLYPYGLISRHERPETVDFFILHEGLIGVIGEESLQEIKYDTAIDDKQTSFKNAKAGWLGITDKYWAAIVIPDQKQAYNANFNGREKGAKKLFQTDYLHNEGVQVAPGKTAGVTTRVFAGAKEINLIETYGQELGLLKFELMIDWGWFHFLTKPLFYALDYFNKFFGNFGLSILFVTLLIKAIMYPLANKSYESMSRMKKLQPEMQKIRERFAEDKMRQQKELMEMYKKEKINPMAGCLPILVQIPVFFALYKVLFVAIDMRHAPFFGWVTDLSAPDPTNLFNLFGLLPFDPPFPFQVGLWAIIMGFTMWVQMRLNPQHGDPIQQAVFNWMPVLFTFMLATFPAGLVIYWAWNNFLSILQQRYIMHKNNVEVNLFENMGLNKLRDFIKTRMGGANNT